MNTKSITFQQSLWLLVSIFVVTTTAISSASSSLTAFSNEMKMFQRIGSRAKTTKTTMAASASVSTSGMISTGTEKPKVAVIGAGAAGIVTARILSSKGFQPFIFEKEEREKNGIGGVWSYEMGATDRPMYRGLRTNLPRELMAFREKKWGGDGTTMSFVTHNDVKNYLKEYVEDHDLNKHISFGCEVKQLTVCSDESTSDGSLADRNDILPWPKVKLEWQHGEDNPTTDMDTFDAVCICNGHYAVPSSPPIEGLQYFKGRVMHSIEYDDPSIFKDQTVLCIGGRASGSDLAREISIHAKKVFLSDTSFPTAQDGEEGSDGKRNCLSMGNIDWVPKTLSFNEKDSSIHFDQLCSNRPNDIDVIIFCSGYDYQFPFINEKSNLELKVVPGERRVSPLYEQLWHAQYPNIAFIGLQHSVVPFPFFEFQAEAIAHQLLKRMGKSDSHMDSCCANEYQVPLSLEERMDAAEHDANSGGPKGARVQDTHFLGSWQWDACKVYAKYGGILSESVEKYINTNKLIYDDSNNSRKGSFPGGPDDYRYSSYVRDDENESFSRYPVTMANADVAQSRNEKTLLSEI